ncbi:MAG: lysophospholipid acyltransferase family protein [Pseudomonadota bacterium]
MSTTWQSQTPPPPVPAFGAAGWARVAIRGLALFVLVFGGLLLMLLMRLLERPLYGARRPLTPFITVFVCRNALRILGIRLDQRGHFAPEARAVVANHASWLDILVLNAVKRVYFVSKAEVAGWPGIGWLARATGTVFIERARARAAEQAALFQARLSAGHRLLFFPEGTSSDGLRVLPFKTTLFAAFFADGLREEISIQPVSVRYNAPGHTDARLYGWWGDMTFGSHFLTILATFPQGSVTVTYHRPLRVAAHADRKHLAAACEEAVRLGFVSAL